MNAWTVIFELCLYNIITLNSFIVYLLLDETKAYIISVIHAKLHWKLFKIIKQ